AGELGFDRYAYCALTGHERYVAGNNPAPAVALNYPASWTDYYFEQSYQVKDPVVLYARELDRPFLWDTLDTLFELDGSQQAIMRQAEEAKLKDGVGVPLHGPHGSVCLLTFAAGDGHPEPAAELQKLAALATQFHFAYSEVGRSALAHRRIPELTPRERECLQWAMQSKSSWEISRILNISENTVNYHIKSAFRKLETNTRIAAVAKALRFGLIDL
ncbi:MAG TPA: LuxR family transcriptional regulator, partial [Woeseiaceae bacterium]|nr:LuxR family transcriptional regulator [Woeseiaceae bacterium]